MQANKKQNSTCVSSGLRIYFVSDLGGGLDQSWGLSKAFIWMYVEPTAGIVCACLPIIRPLLRKFTSIGSSGKPVYDTPRSNTTWSYGRGYLRRTGSNDLEGGPYLLKPQLRPSDDGVILTTSTINNDRTMTSEAEMLGRKGYVEPLDHGIQVHKDFHLSFEQNDDKDSHV